MKKILKYEMVNNVFAYSETHTQFKVFLFYFIASHSRLSKLQPLSYSFYSYKT